MIRFLSKDEEMRLQKALDVREEKLKAAREHGNAWRKERGYPEMSSLQARGFADYMQPMIIISLHTGLRERRTIKFDLGKYQSPYVGIISNWRNSKKW